MIQPLFTLIMELSSLQRRLEILEDRESIKELTLAYADHINHGWHTNTLNPNGPTAIFTTDAVWESADMNIKVQGIDQIIKA